MGIIMKSKENEVLELFFNYPTKFWRFKEFEEKTSLPPSKVDRWLKKFQEEELIQRIKVKGSMPYYIANYENPNYKFKKKIYAFQKLYESGLLNYLSSLKAKTVVLFGSFNRSDWDAESDIDIFVSDEVEINIGKYEKMLKRDIQIFATDNFEKLGKPLLRNIVTGNTLKGKISNEVLNACI